MAAKSQIGWKHVPTVPIFLEPCVYVYVYNLVELVSVGFVINRAYPVSFHMFVPTDLDMLM